MALSGYLRGSRHLNPNRLVHITGFNDYQISHIDLFSPNNSDNSRRQSLRSSATIKASDSENVEMKVCPFVESMDIDKILDTVYSDENRESLKALIDYEPLMNEHSKITDEDLKAAEIRCSELALKGARHEMDGKDISVYQDSWTEALCWSETEVGGEDLSEISDKYAKTNNSLDSQSEIIDDFKSDFEMDAKFESNHMFVNEDAEEREILIKGLLNIDSKLAITDEEMKKLKFQLSHDEMDFPDEVDTPLDQPARQRFARYRGLKSFHNSP